MKIFEWKRSPNEFMYSKNRWLPKIGLRNPNIFRMDREKGALKEDCKGAFREAGRKLGRKSEQMAT